MVLLPLQKTLLMCELCVLQLKKSMVTDYISSVAFDCYIKKFGRYGSIAS